MNLKYLSAVVCLFLASCAADSSVIAEKRSHPYVDDANHAPSPETFPDDLERFKSAQAYDSHKAGVGVVSCTLMPDHHLKDCQVVSESPTGWGFGNSALLVAHWMTMHPKRVNGVDVASQVVIPFRF